MVSETLPAAAIQSQSSFAPFSPPFNVSEIEVNGDTYVYTDRSANATLDPSTYKYQVRTCPPKLLT